MGRWLVAASVFVAVAGGCGGDDDPGVVAHWELAPGEAIDENTTSFSVLVTGTHCSGTEPETVLAPTIDEREHEVRITYFVEPLPPGTYSCEGRAGAPATVQLPAPVGARDLVDGTCLRPDHRQSGNCSAGPERWRHP